MKLTGEIIAQVEVSPGYHLMEVWCPPVSAAARPGQFVQVRCSPGLDPLLRRPLSLHRVNRENDCFSLLYRVQGKGTQLLSQKGPGDELDFMGPLGNGFNPALGGAGDNDSRLPPGTGENAQESCPSNNGRGEAVLVAGGIGVAPLVYLAEEMLAGGRQVSFLIGARSAVDLTALGALEEIQDQYRDQFRVVVCTDDGSAGHRGSVVEALEDTLTRSPSVSVYACGPEAMLAKTTQICLARAVPGQVSLEARMACGVGACLGCAVRAVRAGESCAAGPGPAAPVYFKVCRDGPVFDMGEVVL